MFVAEEEDGDNEDSEDRHGDVDDLSETDLAAETDAQQKAVGAAWPSPAFSTVSRVNSARIEWYRCQDSGQCCRTHTKAGCGCGWDAGGVHTPRACKGKECQFNSTQSG